MGRWIFLPPTLIFPIWISSVGSIKGGRGHLISHPSPLTGSTRTMWGSQVPAYDIFQGEWNNWIIARIFLRRQNFLIIPSFIFLVNHVRTLNSLKVEGWKRFWFFFYLFLTFNSFKFNILDKIELIMWLINYYHGIH